MIKDIQKRLYAAMHAKFPDIPISPLAFSEEVGDEYAVYNIAINNSNTELDGSHFTLYECSVTYFFTDLSRYDVIGDALAVLGAGFRVSSLSAYIDDSGTDLVLGWQAVYEVVQ